MQRQHYINTMRKMQSEAGTGKMSHGIKYSINLNAESWSHSTQPQTIADAFMFSLTLWIWINCSYGSFHTSVGLPDEGQTKSQGGSRNHYMGRSLNLLRGKVKAFLFLHWDKLESSFASTFSKNLEMRECSETWTKRFSSETDFWH